MAYVLDSSFLIDLERGHDAAVACLNEISDEPTSFFVPATVVAEVLSGSNDPAATLDDLAAAGELHDLTVGDAIEAAKLARDAREAGRFPGWMDLLTAAFANERGARIVTANPDHFEGAWVHTYR